MSKATVAWVDQGHSGKPWVLEYDKDLKRRLWLWRGTSTEALEACASPSGALRVSSNGTRGMLIEPKMEAVLALARTGWADGLVLAKAATGMPAIASPWPTAAWYDVYGDEPDVAAFAAGIPECMVQWREERHRGTGTGYQQVVVLPAMPWYYDPEYSALIAALTISAVDALEGSGIRCHVNTVFASTDKPVTTRIVGDAHPLTTIIRHLSKTTCAVTTAVKDYDSPVSESATLFWLGHPAVLRGVVFGLGGGAKGFSESLPSFGITVPVLPGLPMDYPRRGWDAGVVSIVSDSQPEYGAGLLVAVLSLAATIAKWMGRDAALSWIEHVSRVTSSMDGELARWISVIEHKMCAERYPLPHGHHHDWTRMLADCGLEPPSHPAISDILALASGLVAHRIPDEPWGWSDGPEM